MLLTAARAFDHPPPPLSLMRCPPAGRGVGPLLPARRVHESRGGLTHPAPAPVTVATAYLLGEVSGMSGIVALFFSGEPPQVQLLLTEVAP